MIKIKEESFSPKIRRKDKHLRIIIIFQCKQHFQMFISTKSDLRVLFGKSAMIMSYKSVLFKLAKCLFHVKYNAMPGDLFRCIEFYLATSG